MTDADADVAHIDEVMHAVQTIFTTRDTSVQDDAIEKYYASDAVFVDNLIRAKGWPSVKVQFHAVAKLFILVEYSTLKHQVQRHPEQSDLRVLVIDNHQKYYRQKDKPFAEFPVKTTLHLNANGEVVFHQDEWQGKWSNFGVIKRLMGGSSSALMRLFRV